MTDVWAKWEGRVVNGAFPLGRFLGSSDHSVVFLTEYRPLDVSVAAIKLVPADPHLADGQLARWRSLRSLSHPHLLRLFDSGHCQIGGHPFFFVVMEHADQTLAQVLPQRPLTAEELRELLPPTLDALEYLHGRQLVQGQIKPTNMLVVGDQLKLASDTIRPAGETLPKHSRTSVYDAPEVRDTRRSTTAADTWGLGMTLIEALTQKVPESTEAAALQSLPGNIPLNFANTIRRCLNSDPTTRPTLPDLRAALGAAQVPSIPQESNSRVTRTLATGIDARSIFRHPTAVAALALLVIFLGWLAWHGSRGHSPSSPEDAGSAQVPPPVAIPQERPTQSSRAAPSSPAATAATSSVLHQQLPAVPRSAQASIHGHFRVSVRVTVDRNGNVTAATLQDPGPSKYFARLAVDAAKLWKFSPGDSARVWLLQFAFSHESITAQAIPKA